MGGASLGLGGDHVLFYKRNLVLGTSHSTHWLHELVTKRDLSLEMRSKGPLVGDGALDGGMLVRSLTLWVRWETLIKPTGSQVTKGEP